MDARKGELVVSAKFLIAYSINNISNSGTFCHKYNKDIYCIYCHSTIQFLKLQKYQLEGPGISCKEGVGQDSQEHNINIICNKNPF